MNRLMHAALSLVLVGLVTGGLAQTPSTQELDQARVEKHKQTILSRMKREKVTYRGDKPGEIRIGWEWWDRIAGNYIFEKQYLLAELDRDEKYELRPRWVFKDMKVTFQDLFQLGPEDDDKLAPIVSHAGLIGMAPRASFEGLTLLGKHGEVKGVITRKYSIRSWQTIGAGLLTLGYQDRLEYKDKNGKLVTATLTWGWDAYTVRWKDIKDRVVDDMSETKALEDLELQRDARYAEETRPGT